MLTPSYSHPLGTTGVGPIRDSWRRMFTRFPGLRVVPQRMISDDDRVAVWSKIENMPGTPELMELIRVADGRIAEVWALGTIRQNLARGEDGGPAAVRGGAPGEGTTAG